jgi:hypothetical protein
MFVHQQAKMTLAGRFLVGWGLVTGDWSLVSDVRGDPDAPFVTGTVPAELLAESPKETTPPNVVIQTNRALAAIALLPRRIVCSRLNQCSKHRAPLDKLPSPLRGEGPDGVSPEERGEVFDSPRRLVTDDESNNARRALARPSLCDAIDDAA